MHSHVHNSCAMAKKMDEVWIQAFGAGAAVPNRFNTLEQLLESAVKSVRLESEPKLQMAGILAFCEELQRILKIAFVGMLGRVPPVDGNVTWYSSATCDTNICAQSQMSVQL